MPSGTQLAVDSGAPCAPVARKCRAAALRSDPGSPLSAHTGAGPRPGSSATCRKPGSDSPHAPWCSLLQAGRLAGCLLLAVHNSPLVVFAVPGGRSLPAVRPLTFQGGRGKVLNPALGPQNRYSSPLVCAYLRRLAIYLLYLRRRIPTATTTRPSGRLIPARGDGRVTRSRGSRGECAQLAAFGQAGSRSRRATEGHPSGVRPTRLDSGSNAANSRLQRARTRREAAPRAAGSVSARVQTEPPLIDRNSWCLFSTPRPSGRGLLGATWPKEAAKCTRLPGFSSAE